MKLLDEYHARMQKGYLFLLFGIVLIGLYFRFSDLHHGIIEPHVWKQSQVASNIYFYLKDGISVATHMFTKNMEWTIFEFPVYQMIVAGICKILNVNNIADIVLIGRISNIVIYVLTYFTLYGIMNTCNVNKSVNFLVLFFFSTSPLGIFYSRAVQIDNLPVFCGFLSLYYFLKWDKNTFSSAYYIGMIGSGMLATLIKNPVYLPIVITIFLWFILHKEVRRLYSSPMICFFLVIISTVIFFKLLSNYMNTNSLFKSEDWEFHWYFSSLSERLQMATYTPMIKRFLFESFSPMAGAFFSLGVTIYILDKKNYSDKKDEFIITVGLLIGAITTILVFLNVNKIHDYYQIPFIFVASFFAGYFVHWCIKHVSKLTIRYRPFYQYIIKGLMYLVLVMLVLWTTKYYQIGFEPTAMIESGDLIKAETSPDSFVFYAVKKETYWNPSLLYFAQRDGYNLLPDELNTSSIHEIMKKYGAKYRQFYLYIPNEIIQGNEDILAEYSDKVVFSSDRGCLLTLDGSSSSSGNP